MWYVCHMTLAKMISPPLFKIYHFIQSSQKHKYKDVYFGEFIQYFFITGRHLLWDLQSHSHYLKQKVVLKKIHLNYRQGNTSRKLYKDLHSTGWNPMVKDPHTPYFHPQEHSPSISWRPYKPETPILGLKITLNLEDIFLIMR